MSDLRLVDLPLPVLQALADGRPDAAAGELGLAVPDEFARAVQIWRFFIRMLDERPDSEGWTMQAVVEGDVIVGNAGFKGAPADGVVELGYTILSAHRGRGLAKAAVHLLLDRARREPSVRVVIATVNPLNEASAGVLRGVGFRHTGERMHHRDGRQLVFDHPATDHYFSGAPAVADRRHDVTASMWGRELTFTTAAGVFAQNGLDQGTAVLLRHSSPPDSGTVLDLGCGWGPIACALATERPGLTVWATDTNTRALELTALNAARLAARVHVAPPDEIPTDVAFDEIWSNPPIRIGKAALHELLLHWLPRLRAEGRARLVVGKNLGSDSLQRWLIDQGWPTDRVASEKGFRVLEVRPGPR